MKTETDDLALARKLRLAVDHPNDPDLQLSERDLGDLINHLNHLLARVKELEVELTNAVDYRAGEFARLQAQLHQRDAALVNFKWDIEAYRGALGYSVPGNHTGKLTDGTTPQCGICNSQHRKDIDTALNTAREALEHCLEASSDPPKYGRYLSKEDREIVRHSLSQIQEVKP